MDWETPAWQVPLDKANRVELFCLPGKTIVSDQDWPDSFWHHVSERHFLLGTDADRAIHLFRELEPSKPARCHQPRSGLAIYDHEALLVTTTLCFSCRNAYVYTAEGKEQRAFDPFGQNAVDLREVLKQNLPSLKRGKPWWKFLFRT